MSGVPVNSSFTFEKFAGTDFAIVLGSAGALYWGRKNTDASANANIDADK